MAKFLEKIKTFLKENKLFKTLKECDNIKVKEEQDYSLDGDTKLDCGYY